MFAASRASNRILAASCVPLPSGRKHEFGYSVQIMSKYFQRFVEQSNRDFRVPVPTKP